MKADERSNVTIALLAVIPIACVASVFGLTEYQSGVEPKAPTWAIDAMNWLCLVSAGSAVVAVFFARAKVIAGLLAAVVIFATGCLWLISSMAFNRVWL